MHRLTTSGLSLFVLALALGGCGGGKNAVSPDGEKGDGGDDDVSSAFSPEGSDAGAVTETKAAPKKDICVGSDLSNLEELLGKADCEVPGTKPESVQAVDLKGKLEVTVTASPTKVAPGGKTDLLVTFANKSKEPLPLQFRLDPLARFETETYDAKTKRADMPPGKPPPPPKGHTPPPPADQKVGMITLAPNGSARVHVPWEAVKMKWAPQKVRGTAVEKGYPRVAAGPVAKGKYTVKVITPLVGVSEGGEHEVTGPKVDIEVAR